MSGQIEREVELLRQALARLEKQAQDTELPDRTLTSGLVEARHIHKLAFPYGSTKWLWGVDVAGDKITVGAGAIQYNGAIVTCSASSEITITANTQYIGWKYTLATDTLAIDTTPAASAPVPETGILRGTLYKITSSVTGGVRSITNVQPWEYDFPVAPFLPVGSSTDLYLKWNDTNKVWEKVAAVTQAVVTDITYSESTHLLEKTTKTLTVLVAGSPSTTTVTTATAHSMEPS